MNKAETFEEFAERVGLADPGCPECRRTFADGSREVRYATGARLIAQVGLDDPRVARVLSDTSGLHVWAGP